MPKESLDTLISELTHEEDWRRMRATAACLAGGPKAVDGLIHALETASAALRIEAAGMLARLKDPRGGVPLVRLLRDEDAAVRKAGAVALEQMAGVLDTAAASALVQDLREVKDDEQRRVVTALLGVIPNAIEPLTAMLRHPDAEARLTAAAILEHLMRRLKQDRDTGVKEISLKSLGLIGDARPVDLYLDAIPIRPLRVFAMEALAKVKNVEVLGPHVAFFEGLKNDRDGLVSYNAGVIVDKLKALAVQAGEESGQPGQDDQHE